MSTCPKDGLCSAYFDNEITSPWKEKMETHLVECVHCSQNLRVYEQVSKDLQTDVHALNDIELSQSFTRLQSRIRHEAVVKSSYPVVKMPFGTVSKSSAMSVLAAALVAAVVLPTVFFAGANQNRAVDLELISAAKATEQPFVTGVIADAHIRQSALAQNVSYNTASINATNSLSSSIDMFKPVFSSDGSSLRITLPNMNDLSFVAQVAASNFVE